MVPDGFPLPRAVVNWLCSCPRERQTASCQEACAATESQTEAWHNPCSNLWLLSTLEREKERQSGVETDAVLFLTRLWEKTSCLRPGKRIPACCLVLIGNSSIGFQIQKTLSRPLFPEPCRTWACSCRKTATTGCCLYFTKALWKWSRNLTEGNLFSRLFCAMGLLNNHRWTRRLTPWG